MFMLSDKPSQKTGLKNSTGTPSQDMMARKMAAMMALDGKLDAEGLAAMADDGSAALALARSISNAIDADDIQRNWAKMRSNRKLTASALMSFGQDLLEGEPIDGLDIVAIEPHLIARTILGTHDDAGDLVLCRDMLTWMLQEFDNFAEEIPGGYFE
jgi:hypothetical protein